MKRVIFLYFFLLVWGISFATKVEKETATLVALNWMNSNSSKYYDGKDIASVFTNSSDSLVLNYIVSFDSVGWVIVSASDLTEPVIAYSFDSKFDISSMPSQVSSWLRGISSETASAEIKKIAPSVDIQRKWGDLQSIQKKKRALGAVAYVAPLVSTIWNQGRYYNEMAPLDQRSSTGNGHVWIGCVATAMAQVMKFWEYPGNGLEQHSYTSRYGTLSADFANTTYDWGAMPANVTSQNTEVQRISYHAAISAEMDFGPYSSGAYLEDANEGMVQFFKYNSNQFVSYKDDWDNAEWIALLKRELDAGRPIIYSGYNYGLTSGHAWVCDGYSAGDYFHFNWGWSGNYNGNFLLTSLSPGSSDFSYAQGALLGIEPVSPAMLTIPYSQGFELDKGVFHLTGVGDLVDNEVHTGGKSLRLGKDQIRYGAVNSATVSFVVPSEAELNFWVKRITPVASSQNEQAALLLPEFGSTPLLEIFNGDFNDSDWVAYSVDLAAYAGQVVRFMLVQKVFDSARNQWMYVDDISVSGMSNNLPPYIPAQPIPSNLSEFVSLSPLLRWSGGDPNGDVVQYKVLFGTADNLKEIASTANNFLQLPPLMHTTTYYWKIISTDGTFSSEGPVWSFTTTPIPPDLATCGVSNVTAITATLCGNIVNDNGTSISSKGICWTETSLPSLSTQYQEIIAESDTFSVEAVDLLPNTVYRYSTFAISNMGQTYSEVASFKTLPGLAEVDFIEVNNILRSSATVTGDIIRLNDDSVRSVGVVWSTSEGFDPLDANRFPDSGISPMSGRFFVSLTGLPGPATIYARLYVENSVGLAFSDEFNFTTVNSVPQVSLDPNNSSKAGDGNYMGVVIEQQPNGVVCDTDATVSDPDGDTIQKIIIEVGSNNGDSFDMLSIPLPHDRFRVDGDSSARMEITALENMSYADWCEILKRVKYQYLGDSPNSMSAQKIEIKVFDGIAWSHFVTAYIYIIPVNDPPVVQTLPSIDIVPALGVRVSAVAGVWDDSLDKTNCNFTRRYWWQAKDANDNVVDIPAEDSKFLRIDDSLCGWSVRPVEEVTDPGCGGLNVLVVSAAGEWVSVSKVSQTVVFDPIPLHYIHENYFVLSGNATSGLPLTYIPTNESSVTISHDTVYMHNTGSTIIKAVQEGNSCYFPSSEVFKIAVVGRGNQQIIADGEMNFYYGQAPFPLPAIASSGLLVVAESSDSSVLVCRNDSLFITGTGTALLSLNQPGNRNYFAANEVMVRILVSKGEQKIVYSSIDELFFGSGSIPFAVSSSSRLSVTVESSDESILDVNNDSLSIRGVGQAVIRLSQPGNNLWNPAQVELPVVVSRGVQEIYVQDFGQLSFTQQQITPYYSSSSGLEIEMSVLDTTIAQVVDGVIVFKRAGETFVRFAQPGNPFWLPAEKEIRLLIEKSEQIISFEPLHNVVFSSNPVQLNAVSSSGLPVSFLVNDTTKAYIIGDKLYFLSAGEVEVTALQGGNNSWLPAVPAVISIQVEKASQVVSASIPDSVSVKDGFLSIDAEASSGLPVTVESSDNSVAKYQDGMLQLLSPGTITLSFVQPGNSNYESATLQLSLVVYQPVGWSVFTTLKVDVYPNPSSGIFGLYYENADVSGKNIAVGVCDVSGRLLKKIDLSSGQSGIDLSGFREGIYFLKININGVLVTRKVVLKNSD